MYGYNLNFTADVCFTFDISAIRLKKSIDDYQHEMKKAACSTKKLL